MEPSSKAEIERVSRVRYRMILKVGTGFPKDHAQQKIER